MKLKAVVDKLEDVAPEFQPLYTERGGKWEVTGIEGLRTQADVDRVQSALTKERNDHKALREKYAPLADREVADVVATLDRIPELEAAANGKLDAAAIEQAVQTRLRAAVAPIERERDQYKISTEQATQKIAQLESDAVGRRVRDVIREAATKSGMVPSAVNDAIMLAERMFELTEDGRVITKDGVGVTPGIAPTVWLTDMQSTRPHWWPASVGGGASGNRQGGGSSGKNPFSKDGWNFTEQMSLIRENKALAEQMARAAGTTIGGGMPEK